MAQPRDLRINYESYSGDELEQMIYEASATLANRFSNDESWLHPRIPVDVAGTLQGYNNYRTSDAYAAASLAAGNRSQQAPAPAPGSVSEYQLVIFLLMVG